MCTFSVTCVTDIRPSRVNSAMKLRSMSSNGAGSARESFAAISSTTHARNPAHIFESSPSVGIVERVEQLLHYFCSCWIRNLPRVNSGDE